MIFLMMWIAGSIGFAFGWAVCGRMKTEEHDHEIEELKRALSRPY